MREEVFEPLRARMVEEQLRSRGIADERVLAAFARVPRHAFVPAEFARDAYADHPIPIGGGQTISQPYIVALMVSSLALHGHERVLEVGTGSGYQAAILSHLALEVYSVERLPDLLALAAQRLAALGSANVHLSAGNGSLGWPEFAPYEGIVVSAGAPDVPPPLVAQLAEGGRLVLPVGPQDSQTLTCLRRQGGSLIRRELAGCMFVPLLGRHGWRLS
jgi:protein-L-isoaspartate(D-aspartate) O-methyltransferase